MTTINEARESVYERMRTGWTFSLFFFDGDDFDPPEAEPWVVTFVRQRGGGQSTLGGKGNRRYRRESVVEHQVFVPVGKGLQENDRLARLARDLYEGEQFDGLEFNDGRIVEIGPAGKEQQFNVEIDFSYQERK